MSPPQDDALIERAISGDEEALGRLFRQHYPVMLRFAQKICRDGADAEDVTQDAFVTLMGSMRTFDRRSAFSTWLYRVVLNKAIDHRRKRMRRERTAEAFHLVAPSALDAPQHASLAARQIVECLLAFPAKERDAALLVHGEGLTHREAAEIVGCPVGTIGWLLTRAAERLDGIMKVESNDQGPLQDRVREARAPASLAGS